MSFKADFIPASENLDPQTREMLRLMIGQLPIVLAVQNGGEWRVKASDIDKAGLYTMVMEVDQSAPGGPEFVFRTRPKQ